MSIIRFLASDKLFENMKVLMGLKIRNKNSRKVEEPNTNILIDRMVMSNTFLFVRWLETMLTNIVYPFSTGSRL